MSNEERNEAAAAPYAPATEADTDAYFALLAACDDAHEPDDAADDATWLDGFIAESDAQEVGFRALIEATDALLASPLPVRR